MVRIGAMTNRDEELYAKFSLTQPCKTTEKECYIHLNMHCINLPCCIILNMNSRASRGAVDFFSCLTVSKMAVKMGSKLSLFLESKHSFFSELSKLHDKKHSL